MARTTSISFHPCGLRYRSGQIVPKDPPKIMRFELADYPGYVDRVYLGTQFEEFVGVCPECGGRSSSHPSFTPAITWLSEHIFRGGEGCANSDTRPLHPTTQRERELRQGFVVDKIASGGERARCIHAGCAYVSATYARGPMGAFDAGAKHVASAHPDNRIANPGKDTTMRRLIIIDRDLAQANASLEQLHARIDRLNAEREARLKLPAEPDVDNIAFEVQFAPGGIKYSYAAQRVGNVWFLTGRETTGKPWDEVLNFIAQDHRVQAGTRRLQFRELESGRVVKAAK